MQAQYRGDVLLQQLAPDHNTIANFGKIIKKPSGSISAHRAHSKTISINRGQTHCGDSTKLRAQNSKKNNFNERK
ncbi:MAG: hypothetical protein IPI59_15970 [Sphingobacteriales bacterium]|nr:hypothetical protein [Sphingobacteriales bacterium]